MSKALLVIDMQEACVGKNHAEFFKYDSDIIAKVNEEIKANENIVYIRNLMKNNFINKLAPVQIFDGDKGAELAEDLLKKGNAVFDKYKGDAFSNPQLLEHLQKNGIDTVEVVGVDGGGCVALTALGAIENGFKVIVNTKAIGTMFEKKKEKYFCSSFMAELLAKAKVIQLQRKSTRYLPAHLQKELLLCPLLIGVQRPN